MSGFAKLLIVVVLPMTFSACLRADSLTLTTFDYPGGSETYLYGINGNDQMVGASPAAGDLAGTTNLFVTNPQGTILSSWSYSLSQRQEVTEGPSGIDNTGRVAASYVDASNGETFVPYFRAADGTFTPLPFPSGAAPAAMNNDGSLVYADSQNLYFPNGGGTYTTVPLPDFGSGASVTVTGYDDYGDVTGFVTLGFAPAFSFFRDSSGNYTTFSFPGSGATEAQGMNNLGEVVGFYYNDTGGINGFIWSAAGGFTTVVYPGAQDTVLAGISDDGTVDGGYALPDGNYNGLIGTETVATPEPKSAGTVAIGLLIAAIVYSRRRGRLAFRELKERTSVRLFEVRP